MTETETVVVEKEILIPVPPALTETVAIPPLPPVATTLQLGQVYRDTVRMLIFANNKLQEIENLYERD